jgi:tetratricopeptide (TPR) repeat protein
MAHRSLPVIVSILCLAWLSPGLLRAESLPPERAILLYQRKLQRHPADPAVYRRLGDAYIQRARETGDPTYFELAEQALRRSLAIAPRNAGALRHLAYVFFMRHAFEEAAAYAARAIELDPADGHAYGVLGDAYLELGQYEQAASAYQKMIDRDGSLYSYGRLSGLKSLRGDPEGAIADLERAIREGLAHGRPRESLAWAQWQLGSEQWAIGKLPAAEAQYLAALQTYPNYHRALAGLAQVRVAQQRDAEAIDLYRQAIAIIPLPEYAAALGDVYLKLGRAEEAQRQYDLVEYIGRLSRLNQVLYNRELAYFYADHDLKLQEALDLARQELEVRRDIYAYDVLAWALYKNDRPHEASTAMTEALKLGTQDARLFFHAGMIHHRLGEADKARDYLRRALTTNPRFHIRHADLAARTLKALAGQPGLAMTPEQGDAR